MLWERGSTRAIQLHLETLVMISSRTLQRQHLNPHQKPKSFPHSPLYSFISGLKPLFTTKAPNWVIGVSQPTMRMQSLDAARIPAADAIKKRPSDGSLYIRRLSSLSNPTPYANRRRQQAPQSWRADRSAGCELKSREESRAARADRDP